MPSGRFGDAPPKRQPPPTSAPVAAMPAHSAASTLQFAENLLEPVTSKDAWDDEIGDIPWDNEISISEGNSLPLRNTVRNDSKDVGNGNLGEPSTHGHNDTADSKTGHGTDQQSQQQQQPNALHQQHNQYQSQLQGKQQHPSQEPHSDRQQEPSLDSTHLRSAYAPHSSTTVANTWEHGDDVVEPDMWGETEDLDLGWDDQEVPHAEESQASQLPDPAAHVSTVSQENQLNLETQSQKIDDPYTGPSDTYQDGWHPNAQYEPPAENNFWEDEVDNVEQQLEPEYPSNALVSTGHEGAFEDDASHEPVEFQKNHGEEQKQNLDEPQETAIDLQKTNDISYTQDGQNGIHQEYSSNHDHYHDQEFTHKQELGVQEDYKHDQEQYADRDDNAHNQDMFAHNQDVYDQNQDDFTHNQDDFTHNQDENTQFQDENTQFQENNTHIQGEYNSYQGDYTQNPSEHNIDHQSQSYNEKDFGNEHVPTHNQQESNPESAATESQDLDSSEHGFNQMIDDFEKFNVHGLSLPEGSNQTPQNFEEQNHERHVELFNADQLHEPVHNEPSLSHNIEDKRSYHEQSQQGLQHEQLQDYWNLQSDHLNPNEQDTLSRKYTLETVSVNEGTQSPGLHINYSEQEFHAIDANLTEGGAHIEQQPGHEAHNQPEYRQSHVDFGQNDTVIYSPVRKDFVPDDSFLPEEEVSQQAPTDAASPKSLELMDLDDDFLLDEDFLDDDLLEDNLDTPYDMQPVDNAPEPQYVEGHAHKSYAPVESEPQQVKSTPAKRYEPVNKYVPSNQAPAVNESRYTGTFNQSFGGFNPGLNSGNNADINVPTQPNVDHQKIMAEKKKNDAYDFPEGFVKPIKPVTRMKSTPKLPQPEQLAPDSLNQVPQKQEGPPPITSQKLFFEDLPIVKAPPPAKRPAPVKKEEVPKLPEVPKAVMQPPAKSPKNPYANLKTKQGGILSQPNAYAPPQAPGFAAGPLVPGMGGVGGANMPYHPNVGPNQQMMNGGMPPQIPQGLNGPQVPQGPPGAPGVQVPSGHQGPPAFQGAPGVAPGPQNGPGGPMVPQIQTQGKYQPPVVTHPPQNRGQGQNPYAPGGPGLPPTGPIAPNAALAPNAPYAPNAPNAPYAPNASYVPNGPYAPGGNVNAYSPRVAQMDRASSLNVPAAGPGPQLPFPTVHEHRSVSQQSRSYELKSPLDAYIPPSGPYTPSAKVSHSRKSSVLAGNRDVNPYAIAAQNGPMAGPMAGPSVRRGTAERVQPNARQSDTFRADPNTIFHRQLPLFKWGPSDQVVTAIPRMSMQGVSTVLRIARAEELVSGAETYNEFPGPLIKGKTKKKDLETWITRHLEKLRSSGSSLDEVTLVEVLNVLVANDGAFLSDKVQKEIAAVLTPHVDYSTDSNPLMSGVPAGALNAHRLDAAGSNVVWNYIQTGNTNAALQFALSKDDWALSIIIAHSLGPSVFTRVCSDFARKCHPVQKAHGTKSQHMMPILMKLFVGNAKDVIEDFVNIPSEGDFARKFHRDIVAAAIVNGTSLEFLVEFGKFLADSNMPAASELCLVIGGLLLSRTPLNNGAVFAYVGSFTHTSIYTELYEYLLLTSNLASAASGTVPATGFPHTFPMKVKRAEELADMGAFAASRRYCDFIGGALRAQTKNPYVNSKMSANFQRLIVRLSDCSTSESGWLGNTLSKVNLDVWGSLDKFLGGEPSSTKTDKGVFSNFSPSVSRNTSQLDISQIPVPGQRLDMHAPHYAGSSAATSGISSPNRGHQSMRYAPQGMQQGAHMPQGQVLNYLPKQQQPQTHQMGHSLKYNGRVASHVDSSQNQSPDSSSSHSRLSISARERVNHLDSYEASEGPEHTQRKTSVKTHSRVSSLLSEIHMNPPHNSAPAREEIEKERGVVVHGDSTTTLKMSLVEEDPEALGESNALDRAESPIDGAEKVVNESVPPVQQEAPAPPSAPPASVSSAPPAAPPVSVPSDTTQSSGPPPAQDQNESAAPKNDAPPAVQASSKPSSNSEYSGMLPTRSKPLRAPRGKRNANPYAPASAQVNKYAPTETKDVVEPSVIPESAVEQPEQVSNTIVATQIETRVEITQVETGAPNIDLAKEKIEDLAEQVEDKIEHTIDNERENENEKESEVQASKEVTQEEKEVQISNEVVEEKKVESKEAEEAKADKPDAKPVRQPIANRQPRAPRKANPYAPAGAQTQHPQANANPYAPKKAARSYAPAVGGDASTAAPNHYRPDAKVTASTTANLAAANLDISFDNGAEDVDDAEIKPGHEPLLLNSSNAAHNNSAYLNPFNTGGARPDRANAALDEFPIPNTPDYTSRANSVVGQPGLYSSRLSQQSALHQQYEVKDDTVVDYVPVPEEDDDEDMPPAKVQKKKFEKIQEEMTRKGGAASNEGGWFKSFLGSKQQDGKPKPTRANLGNANTFKYDEKLRRWIDTSRPLEEQLQEEKLDPPPMMPSMAASSRQPAAGPGASGPSVSSGPGVPGASLNGSGPSGPNVPSGPQVSATSSIPTGPTKLEDLLGAKQPARAARKGPRRYVNVINQS